MNNRNEHTCLYLTKNVFNVFLKVSDEGNQVKFLKKKIEGRKLSSDQSVGTPRSIQRASVSLCCLCIHLLKSVGAQI